MQPQKAPYCANAELEGQSVINWQVRADAGSQVMTGLRPMLSPFQHTPPEAATQGHSK